MGHDEQNVIEQMIDARMVFEHVTVLRVKECVVAVLKFVFEVFRLINKDIDG